MFVSVWKRRLVVHRFQYRLVAGNFLYLAAVVVVFFIVLFAPIVTVLLDDSVPVLEREVAAHQFLTLHERVWFALPVLVALCLLHSVVVSHRVAGPLHRFKQILASLAQGDLTMNAHVRKHDYLGREADIMAATLESLRSRIGGIAETHRRTAATLPELMAAVERGDGRESAVLAGKLGTQLDLLGRQIRCFRMPSDETTPAPRIDAARPTRTPEAVATDGEGRG